MRPLEALKAARPHVFKRPLEALRGRVIRSTSWLRHELP
jgi:hypothetical protein